MKSEFFDWVGGLVGSKRKAGADQKPDTRNQKPVAGAAPAAGNVPPSLAPLLRPQAVGRWLLPQLSTITPQYIELVLRGALAGNHVQQWQLFDLMLDTWPELAACAQELLYGVQELKLMFRPFAEDGERPLPEALERQKLVSTVLRRMMPEVGEDANDLPGTIADIADGWFRGVTCLGIDWETLHSTVSGTTIAPRCTYWVDPVWFAFDAAGRLGLRVDANGALSPMQLAGTSSQARPAVVGAFPPHRFLVGIHKAKAGSPLGSMLLRPLCWWWCAANFSADWLLNLAQVFGLPFRWASYDPTAAQETVDRVCQMLQSMGSNGWAAFPAGTTMNLVEPGRAGGDHSPQGELLDRADRYARLLILGQTMSGSQDASRGGGKAFGAVESEVKATRVDAAGQYVCGVLKQLVRSILILNYGDAELAPEPFMLADEKAGAQEAQRDHTLANAGLRIGVNYLRAKYGNLHPRPPFPILRQIFSNPPSRYICWFGLGARPW